MRKLFLIITGFSIILSSCSKSKDEPAPLTKPPVVLPPTPVKQYVKTHLVDTNATNETAALFYNLKKLSKTHFAIGQQDAFTGFYQDVTGSSDIKKSTGFDPALLGSDFLFITDKNNNGQANNWFYQQEVKTRTAVIDAYNKGMINIFCWHLREPNREDSFYASDMSETEKNTAFRSILPGGAKHEWYKLKLDKVASVISNLKGSDGKLIPVIFRPFHEFDGSWFWWGANFCTPEEFKTGFKFTVDYLKKTKGVHNILYSFGPDNSYDTEAKYLSRYPGDDYVDILGIDDYGDFNTNSGITGSNRANVKLKVISDLAKARGKIAALTETGYRVNSTTPPINGWFSNFLYNALTANDIEIAFVMLWVNSTNSYYVPTPSAPNVQDFLDFTNKPKSVLVNKLPSMYTIAD